MNKGDPVGYDCSYIDCEWYIDSIGKVIVFKTEESGNIKGEKIIGIPDKVLYKATVKSSKAVYSNCIVLKIESKFYAFKFNLFSYTFSDDEFNEVLEPHKVKPTKFAGIYILFIFFFYN